jgi:ribosome-associated protein
VEGRKLGEWILMDYVDFVVHIFLSDRREYYDIERLRKSARRLDVDDLKAALTVKTLAVREISPVNAAKKGTKTIAKKSVAKKIAATKTINAAKKKVTEKTVPNRQK